MSERSVRLQADVVRRNDGVVRSARLRLAVGFLLTPLAAGVVTLGTLVALWKLDAWVLNGTPDIDAALSLALSAVVVAIPLTIGGVVPLVMWLIERRQLTLRHLLLWGCVLGIVPVAVIVGWGLTREAIVGTMSLATVRAWLGWQGALRASLFGLWFGATLAAVFWAVAVRGSAADADHRGVGR